MKSEKLLAANRKNHKIKKKVAYKKLYYILVLIREHIKKLQTLLLLTLFSRKLVGDFLPVGL